MLANADASNASSGFGSCLNALRFLNLPTHIEMSHQQKICILIRTLCSDTAFTWSFPVMVYSSVHVEATCF